MAIVKELKVDKLDPKSKKVLIESLEEIIERVKNNEIELFAATTLDTGGNVASYHARLRNATLLEVIGMVDVFNDHLRYLAREE